MITQKQISKILKGYDKKNITIGVLGGHSALDVCRGAHFHGFKTLVVAQKGREKSYSKYYKRREGIGFVDDVMLLDKFSVSKDEVIFVGDAPNDLQAAQRAKIKFVALLTGVFDKKTAKKMGADYIIHDITKIGKLVKEMERSK